jgi:pyruvate formate-lyase activating enzyme-like uncharacterized protein
MKLKKTDYESYCLNGICSGCKQCVVGRKLVLFITGLCSVNCVYCPLSQKRKNVDKIWANERPCDSVTEVLDEVRKSHAQGCGITGGDPLCKFERTIEYASALKKEFGSDFHIHIYLSTLLIDREKLKQLSKVIDEIRFHPLFLSKGEKEIERDKEKIKLASEFWEKENIGIEMPCFPEKKKEILDFILNVKNLIGFVNLNELEIGDSNFDYITGKYKLDKEGYTIQYSLEAGKWILRELEKLNSKLKVHLCSAETKNWYQFRNRLKNYDILPFGRKTKDGTVGYYAVYSSDFKKIGKELGKDAYVDEKKKRVILNPEKLDRWKRMYKVELVEEYPTWDGDEVEREEL